ncbi:ShK domain-like family protein [Acanthocheilonema viteae]
MVLCLSIFTGSIKVLRSKMAIIYHIIILTFIFIGSLKSDCVEGTSRGCYQNEICYRNQCYPAYGPCFNGVCQQNLICIFDSCLNLLITTTTQKITTKSICMDYNIPGRLSECPKRAYLCNNPIYYNLMTKLCQRTCNRCSGDSSTMMPSGCFDQIGPNGRSNCLSVAHLCHNLLYINVMKQQCARTCRFC